MSLAAALPLATPLRGRPPTVGLREHMLQAAAVIFTRHDYHEVRMDDVARATGAAKGTLYRYFPSKRALYLAVMFDGIAKLQDELRATVEAAAPPATKIEGIVHCILAHFWDRRFFFALIHRNEHRPDDPDNREWLRRRRALSQLIQRAVEEAIAAGQLRPIEPRIATEMLLGMLRGANRYRGAHDSLPALVAAVIDIFVRGAGTPAARRQRRRGRTRKR